LSAHLPKQEEKAEKETKVADPVHHEGLVPRDGIGVILVPKADQEIRTQPDPLPADKKEQQIVGHDQEQHEKDEEVEIGKVADHPLVVAHISERVNMDQKPHSGDRQEHHCGQSVDAKCEICPERLRLDPGKHGIFDSPCRRKDRNRPEGEQESEPHGRAGQEAGSFSPPALAEEDIERRREERDQRDEAQ